MGGRGPPYWMKCLMCLAKPSEKTQFFIGIIHIQVFHFRGIADRKSNFQENKNF